MTKAWLVATFIFLIGNVRAQESRWLLGAGLTYCSFINGPGLNANLTYRLIKDLHIGPDFSALLTQEERENGTVVKRKELEYNFNATYLVTVSKRIACYPLTGINVSKVTVHKITEAAQKRWVSGLNIGSGIEVSFTKCRFFAEGKFVTGLKKYDFSVGILFDLYNGKD